MIAISRPSIASPINTADVDRYSIPMFFGPSGDALIECIPTCQSPDRPARHEPITYRKLREWYYGLRDDLGLVARSKN